MIHEFPFLLLVIVLIIFLILLANKLKVAYPIVLVLGGLAACFVPSTPELHIDPELIFVIFLPPLLYEAAWATSWKELWKWRRIITSFAFIVVFLTAIVVAIVANQFIPGFSLALGFLLGGIVSPPDAVSAGAIMKFVKVPTRFKSIIEGESLFNDASSLLILRFALAAVATGQFIWQDAALSFTWMIFGGIGIGLLLAFVFYKAHKLLPTNAEMDIVLTLIAPYVMYIAAETVHSSGVMAVVCGGLFLASKKHIFLSAEGRIKSNTVWEALSFVLNGLVFIMIGLDLPEIVDGLGDVSLRTALGYGLLITAVLIIVRILASYGAVLVTLVLRNFITLADNQHPGYKAPFLLGWSGMRGVVSLAAALSIPTVLADGTPFPQRNLILFITFVVILVTLILQGLTLPFLIKKLDIRTEDEKVSPEDEYYAIYKELNKKTFEFTKENFSEHPRFSSVAEKYETISKTDAKMHLTEETKNVLLEIIENQRKWLRELNKSEEVEEEIVKMHEHRLDLEEMSLGYK